MSIVGWHGWLRRKQGVSINGKRVLRVMRERGLLVAPRRLRARRNKEWGRVRAEVPNQVWQSDMTKVRAGANVGWAYLASVIDCCTREIVGWELSLRCRTQEAIAAVERAVPEAMVDGSRGSGLVLTTDNGTQVTSARFVETLSRLGITHRRTAYNHPEAKGLVERFHRSLKEEEIQLNEYRSLGEATESIARWISEYHDRPHRALRNQTPGEARAGFVQPQPLPKPRPSPSGLGGRTTNRSKEWSQMSARTKAAAIAASEVRSKIDSNSRWKKL